MARSTSLSTPRILGAVVLALAACSSPTAPALTTATDPDGNGLTLDVGSQLDSKPGETTGETGSSGDSQGPADIATSEDASLDAGLQDVGPVDASKTDTNKTDTGSLDTVKTDTATTDTAKTDTSVTDVPPSDAAKGDTGVTDAVADTAQVPDTTQDVPKDSAADAAKDAAPDTTPDTAQPPTCPPGSNLVSGTCRIDCEVLVVGESMGGTAAALAASSQGVKTCLVRFDPWLGGQATSQGVSALDEGIPSGALPHWSKAYRAFRDEVRASYLNSYAVTAPNNDSDGAAGPGFDPGSCWVSRLCYQPQVGAGVLAGMAEPLVTAGKLVYLDGYALAAALKQGALVQGVVLSKTKGNYLPVEVRAQVTLDATELGDLYPLTGAAFRTGAEAKSDTGEPHARSTAAPECVQPFTYTFVLEKRPASENHQIPKPNGYDKTRYNLTVGSKTYPMFAGDMPFWTYRRLVAAGNFAEPVAFPYDLAMINWGPDGNDYDTWCWGGSPSGCNLIGKNQADFQAVLAQARDYTLGFVYWLQHDAPRDDGSCCGYANLLLRKDVFTSSDGLSSFPYIREARRLVATTTVVETDLADDGVSARAKLFGDSVGTGLYPMDLHTCAAGEPLNSDPTWKGKTRPYQLPASALVPKQLDGLLAAAKNIGATHLTNGAYREHPIEWHIGEAAGILAARTVATGLQPRQIVQSDQQLRVLQHLLISERKMPLFWWSDLAPSDGALWNAAQFLGARQNMIGFPDSLAFKAQDTLPRGFAAALISKVFNLTPVSDCHPSFADVPCSHSLYSWVQALADAKLTSGCGGGLFCVDDPVTRAQFATFLVRGAGWPVLKPAVPTFDDVPTEDVLYGYVETAQSHGLFADVVWTSSLQPTAAATRGEAALMAYNYLKTYYGL